MLGADPTDPERVLKQIRSRGGFKPHGTPVSMVEVACLDITGKVRCGRVVASEKGPRTEYVSESGI